MSTYARKECVACGIVKPANEMVSQEEKVLRSQSGWGINLGRIWGLRHGGAFLGLLKAPRSSYGFKNQWYCQDCWRKK